MAVSSLKFYNSFSVSPHLNHYNMSADKSYKRSTAMTDARFGCPASCVFPSWLLLDSLNTVYNIWEQTNVIPSLFHTAYCHFADTLDVMLFREIYRRDFFERPKFSGPSWFYKFIYLFIALGQQSSRKTISCKIFWTSKDKSQTSLHSDSSYFWQTWDCAICVYMTFKWFSK